MRQSMLNKMILIVDDNADAAGATRTELKKLVPDENISHASTASEAVSMIESGKFSLVFLDIELLDTTGFAIAEYIDKHHKELPYVFLTGHAGYAVDSFDFEPLDFLTKPIDFMRLNKTIDRFEKKKSKPSVTRISINTEDGMELFRVEDILYVEKRGRKNYLQTAEGRSYAVNYSLSEIELILEEHNFFRCHQSFLVNLASVTGIKTVQFGRAFVASLAGGAEIPISRAKYPLFKDRLKEFASVNI